MLSHSQYIATRRRWGRNVLSIFPPTPWIGTLVDSHIFGTKTPSQKYRKSLLKRKHRTVLEELLVILKFFSVKDRVFAAYFELSSEDRAELPPYITFFYKNL